jgi:hypothetical protein
LKARVTLKACHLLFIKDFYEKAIVLRCIESDIGRT